MSACTSSGTTAGFSHSISLFNIRHRLECIRRLRLPLFIGQQLVPFQIGGLLGLVGMARRKA